MRLIYQQKGGGAIGYSLLFSWQGSWPCAKLQIYSDRVILSVWPFKSTIKIKDINSITSFFWGGIRINHHGPNASYLVFYPFNKAEAADAFRKIGLKLKD